MVTHDARLRIGRLVLLVATLALAVAADAFAQGGGNSRVTGTVMDNVGVVPGAAVSLTESATGVVRTGVTDENGVFRFVALPPGPYTVKVEMEGYKPVDVAEFVVDSGAVRDLGHVTLVAGGITEQVTVIAAVTPVQVAESSRQSTVTADQLRNIQMKGRDLFGLLAVIPGVQDANLSRDSTSWRSANNITINGSPTTSNNVMIDGIAQRDEYGTNAFVNPNIDAIAEIQVVANGFTAENGRNSGGLINFVTKSGSTSYHGSGWYNARRDAWNANDYVRIRQGQPKPLYDVNVGGYSIGGPVIIPGLIDSRAGNRKVFFFLSQEFTKDARPTETATANYPTALERQGDFSQTYLTTASEYGAVQPIIDYTTGEPFPGNVIPQDRINPIGQKMLDAMQMPNGYVPPGANQQFNANFINADTPRHNRIDYVFRGDVVLSNHVRFSGKLLADQENNIQVSAFGPGVGLANNTVPAWLLGGTLTWVVNPTLVNELNTGFTINHYNERGYPNSYDYTQAFCSKIGVCPPRIAPYGTYYGYNDPPQNAACEGTIDGRQVDQYPYFPQVNTAGGDRTGLANWHPGLANGRVMPTCNHDRRFVLQDDVSKTLGRHSLKFGVYIEDDATLAPIAATNYMGVYNFGSSSSNPRDTGNGYANMLLGVVTSYNEATNRVAWNFGHWMNEAYAQDSWRVNSRVTMEYGLRVSHIGPFYELNDSTGAFYPELFDPSAAVRLYRPYCTTGAPGNAACPAGSQAAIDPANPGVFLPFQFAGTVVPESGDFLNGIRSGGLKNEGRFYHFPYLRFAPRFGLAWDTRGTGKEAIRASAGIFYDFPRNPSIAYVGVPPVSYNNVVNNVTLDQIAAYSSGGGLTFTRSPVSGSYGLGASTLDGERKNVPVTYNANLAYQRDIGFNTVAEVAYVGNWTRNDRRTYDLQVLPLYGFADPAAQFNRAPLSEIYLYLEYPGIGRVTDFQYDQTSLSYNSLQFSLQRRLSQGLQMGMAYTLSKGMGMRGWDPYTADPSLTINMGGTAVRGGDDALRRLYWGPTSVDRRHNLTVNYSYQFPTLVNAHPILRALLSDWQVSGITKFLSGTAVNPSCSNTTDRGVAFSQPSLTNRVTARCVLTGEPINMGQRIDPDPSDPDPLTAKYFNVGAFTMASPLSDTVGDFGNAGYGVLRNPSVSEWDVTLQRRIPIGIGRNGGVRIQIQAYNLFNQVEFTSMSASMRFRRNATGGFTQTSSTVGTLSNVINPRALALTLRLDF